MWQVSARLGLLKIYILIVIIKYINNRTNSPMFAGIINIKSIIVMMSIIIAVITT